LSLEELLLLNEVIGEELGLHFAEPKRQILESRLGPRLQALHLHRFMDYYLLLKCDREREVPRLAELLTNNETYFWREARHFAALAGRGLDELLPHTARPGTLRILCAGCSSGEEAYSLRLATHQASVRLAHTRVEIEAFDVDARQIERARRAEYGRSSLRALDAEQIARLLTPAGVDRWQVRRHYREGVRFRVANLLQAGSFWDGTPYDCVFCRNVLIYFSEAACRRAVANFAQVLRPGGLLFLGHSESIIGMYPEFNSLRLGDSLIYRRVERRVEP
jgi:chemotaxis protein methyltransferase CheR